MARGPDGGGVGAGESLADHLFNERTLGQLAREYSLLPGFDGARFLDSVLPGLPERTLLARLDWIADAVAAQLPDAFPAMADALEAAMPPALNADLQDDDFGQFIHAVPGILAVRHGLEAHRDRALDLLLAATQRFSMEFYIRPFLNHWPQETLARLEDWARHENYHVRRLVSEGTRPKLPWAKAITLDPAVPLRFLNVLHGDPTRYVTRSVANHMNDLSKVMPDVVVDCLKGWQDAGAQDPREMDWITRHALRTAVKRGEAGALALLGYRPGRVRARLEGLSAQVTMGEALTFSVVLDSVEAVPVMVDYRLRFARPDSARGGRGEKVFKLKTAKLTPGKPLRLEKRHVLRGDASTFQLHPGAHGVVVQVNGEDLAEGGFELLPA